MADTKISADSTKTTPIGADLIPGLNSESSNANVKFLLSALPVSTPVETRLGGANAPSATELSYAKGLTSAAQTQLDNKVPQYVSYVATATAKDVVYMTAAGTAARARANALATMYAFGFATETKTAAACIIQTGGIITITGATFTPGLPVYISKDTAGLLVQDITGYTYSQMVGVAETATDVRIIIGPVVVAAAAVLTVPSGGTGLSTVAANSYVKGADAGALVPRTYAEVKTDLSLNNVDNTSNATERAAAATLTNKRITKRVVEIVSDDATITSGNTGYDCDTADVFSISGLTTAIALATELRTDIIAHFANATRHITGQQSTASIGAVPTTLATLLATAGTMLTLYAAHNADVIKASAWDYHDAQDTTHALVSAVTPTTLLEAVTRLNDLKAKYNAHELESTGHHGVGTVSADQTAAADAVQGLKQATDFAAPGGTPTDEQPIEFRILGAPADPGAMAITWNSTTFKARGVALPTTTVVDKWLRVLFLYNGITSTFDCVASVQEA